MAKKYPPLVPPTPLRRRVFIVDDHPMMREGMRGTINREPDLMVCCEAENARRAMEHIERHTPDLVLLDVNLPDKSGLELVKDIKAIRPQLKILAISMHDESLYAERMLRAGASGYITKQKPNEELIKAIRLVLDGHLYVSKEVSESVLRRFSGETEAKQSPLGMLTDREFEIFQLIGEGKSPKEIAELLHLSSKTVAVHNANIRQKLHLKSTAQLIRFAVQAEDLKLPDRR